MRRGERTTGGFRAMVVEDLQRDLNDLREQRRAAAALGPRESWPKPSRRYRMRAAVSLRVQGWREHAARRIAPWLFP